MRADIAMISRTGARERNEDALGVWSHEGVCYCALADGAGGLGGGDRAAQLVVRELLGYVSAQPGCSGVTVAAALDVANRALVEAQREDPRYASMRATALLLALDTVGARAVWGHLGDSRLYCFREGAVAFQTVDHSVVQEMVAAGYLRPDQLRSAPERSQLLGALGEVGQMEPTLQGEGFAVLPGDAFLLCTDGCWEPVAETQMIDALHATTTAADWLECLQDYIVKRGAAKQDNYSAIAVRCE
ncbi:MAG TPA: PP2C family serine/threonine-protein phosphatase [Burkholderiaceae bacterium]|nr:PP2C family serine/threonine-protein phosphatase [Burkholderiaceae bacterium]